jgi:hypothetical protein
MPEAVNLNAIDFGTAFLPEDQDPTQAPGATPGATSFAATNPDSVRSFRGYGAINTQLQRGWETFHSIQLSLNRRFTNGLSLGFNDTITLYDHASTPARLQHDAAGTYVIRADQSQADVLLGQTINQIHIFKGNFVWDLPDLASGGRVRRAVGMLVNDWQLSGVWSAATGAAYTAGFSYQSGGGNVNLTGSPDYAARIHVVGDPGSGCSADVYRQFNAGAFEGPQAGSVGLESGTGYLRGCFSSALDLAIARTIRLSTGRTLQLRLDVFNAPNAAGVTARNATMSLKSPTDPSAIQNLPFDADGNLIAARSRPRGAGFGVATGYQSPRMLQAQIRFSF